VRPEPVARSLEDGSDFRVAIPPGGGRDS